MTDRTYLEWPFFEPRHRAMSVALEDWLASAPVAPSEDVDAVCRAWVDALGKAGWLRHVVPRAYGGETETFDVRTLCLVRETLGRHEALADFAFAMQGLGTGALTLFGTEAQKQRYLPAVGRGERIAAFALSEKNAGSDVAAMSTRATPDGKGWVLDGEKTWISNGGIADHYLVFARTEDAPGARGLSAFIVDANTAGLTVTERIEVMAPHPLATLRFSECRVGPEAQVGPPGQGFKVAMATLDVFRSTVGAAALGFARRALDEAVARATSRPMFGGRLADQQLILGKLADMATSVDAAALLVYRAAWTRDQGAARVTREAAMAKLFATEAAQTIIDEAVQIHGGLGVTKGVIVEGLYREIRALRIYEGASEVQKVVIARQLLSEEKHAGNDQQRDAE